MHKWNRSWMWRTIVAVEKGRVIIWDISSHARFVLQGTCVFLMAGVIWLKLNFTELCILCGANDVWLLVVLFVVCVSPGLSNSDTWICLWKSQCSGYENCCIPWWQMQIRDPGLTYLFLLHFILFTSSFTCDVNCPQSDFDWENITASFCFFIYRHFP